MKPSRCSGKVKQVDRCFEDDPTQVVQTDVSAESSLPQNFGSASAKHLIVNCAEESDRLPVNEMSGRVDALETSVKKLASNFVKYQEDLAAILANEFIRLTQKMQSHEQKLQEKLHNFKSHAKNEAVSIAKEHIMAEINAEWAPLRDLVAVSGESTCTSVSVTKWSARETKNTADASVTSETIRELKSSVQSTRKDIDMVHSDLRAHITATEKRLAALEIGGVVKQKTDKESSHAERLEEFLGGLIDNVSTAINSPQLSHVSQHQSASSVQSGGSKSPNTENGLGRKLVTSPKVTDLCRMFESSTKVQTRDISASKLIDSRGRSGTKTAPGSITAPGAQAWTERSPSVRSDSISFDPFPQSADGESPGQPTRKVGTSRSWAPNSSRAPASPIERSQSRRADIPSESPTYHLQSSSLTVPPHMRIRRTLPGRFQIREVPKSPNLEPRSIEGVTAGYVLNM